MPEVTVTLTLKVEHTDRTEVTTFKPPTTLEPGRVHSILTDAAERLTGQQHLPLDAGDADPAFVNPAWGTAEGIGGTAQDDHADHSDELEPEPDPAA